jgi:hypothetical protein
MQPLSLGLRRDPIDHPRHEPSNQRPKAGGIGASDDDDTPPVVSPQVWAAFPRFTASSL